LFRDANALSKSKTSYRKAFPTVSSLYGRLP
jgi:hypothetical protein